VSVAFEPDARPAAHPVVSSLVLDGIGKQFGSFRALDDASFDARRGEVHALLGENGAGKSTLMNIASGLYLPDAGSIRVNGAVVSMSGPRDAARLRIGMVHQHFKLVRPFTIAENFLLANPAGGFAIGMAAVEAAIAERGGAMGFALDPRRRVDSLSVAEQQQVEILKVLLSGADILILDEPSAVLTDAEAERMLATMQGLARQGTAVILVTHKLHEVMRYADRVTVMRGGRTIAHRETAGVTPDELTHLIVGKAVTIPHREPHQHGETRLYVSGLSSARADGHVVLRDATFSVHAGEIYGIAGVTGNGQSELAETIMGVNDPVAGTIEVFPTGRIDNLPPERRRGAGVAAIPADRYVFALAGQLSIVENYAVGEIHTGRYGGWSWLRRRRMAADATAAIAAFDVQGVRGLSQKAALLSGGNAQKLVLARELGRQPSVIIAHSPSRGLDIQATAAVRARLLAASQAGAAVLLISDDLDEILSLSDRIGVMARGRIVAEFDAPADRHAVGRAMVDHA
jgi:simple sugar transport system ATP-binding protein